MEAGKPATPSVVYFIQHGDYGPVKIGWAVDPEQRRRELQTGNPERLHIRVLIPGDRVLEKELHRRFVDWHIQGEWFGGGGQSLAILTFALGLKEERDELVEDSDEPVDYIGRARRPITQSERHDLRYDIERLWMRKFNPKEIAAELDRYWGISEEEVRTEIKEMRKSTIWNVGRQPGITYRPTRGAA